MVTRADQDDALARAQDQIRALGLQMHTGFETLNRRLGTMEETLARIERSLEEKSSKADLLEIEKILHQKPDRAEIKDENRTLVLIVVSVATLFAGLFTAMQALL